MVTARVKRFRKRAWSRKRATRRRRGSNGRRKSLIKLIKSVSLSTQETKKSISVDTTLWTTLPPLGAANWAFVRPLWANLPDVKNTLTPSDQGSFIGDIIYVRGVRMRFAFSQTAPTLPVATTWRMTVVSTTKSEDLLTPTGVSPIPTSWYEFGSVNMPAPYRTFNMQRIKPLWSSGKRVTNQHDTNASFTLIDHYQKFNRKFKKAAEDSAVLNNTWGLNTGRDYYMIIEGYKNNNTSISQDASIQFENTVYFKDA